jgi:hypothetical protein
MEYHLVRNETAQRSHAKRWKKQHKRTNFKLLL